MKIFTLILFLTSYFTVLSNPWIQKADFGGVGRHRAVGISIGNKGYIGLGHVNGTGVDIDYNDWWQFDPSSNSWSQKANYPVYNHGATAFGTDTKGYVGGGSALNGEFFAYNPQTNTWSPIAPCPINSGDSQVFSVQNKGYVYLGNQLAEYTPFTNTWVMKANAPVSFGTWSCSFASEGSGFVKSGVNLYEYKPTSNQWIQRANFPGLMSNGSAAFSKDQKGYFTCGYVGWLSNVTNEVWEFNPGNNSWTFICEFLGTSRRFPVAFSVNGKGYFGTGTNGINMNDFWEFDFDPLEIKTTDFSSFKVISFPNPSIDDVNFQFKGVEQSILSECKLIIQSSDGRITNEYQITSDILQIERNDLKSGIYFYSVLYKDNSIHSGKLTFY